MVEREIDGGLISRAPAGPYGRAPKGDGGQSSLLTHPYGRACLRILKASVLKAYLAVWFWASIHASINIPPRVRSLSCPMSFP